MRSIHQIFQYMWIFANFFQRIRGEAALPCIKNCLMASTIVITAGVNVLPPNDDQVSRLCDSILESLSDPAVSPKLHETLLIYIWLIILLDYENGGPMLPLDLDGHA